MDPLVHTRRLIGGFAALVCAAVFVVGPAVARAQESPEATAAGPEESNLEGSGTETPPGELAVVRGVLLVRGTREPLATAFVVAIAVGPDGVDAPAAPTVEALTDVDGTFEIRGLDPGRWRLVVDEVGFESIEHVETLEPGRPLEVTYYLERDEYGEYVSTTIGEAPREEVTRRTLSGPEIQRIPGNNNDAVRVVQNLPGVARAQFGGGDVIVRGSEAADTGFFLDGLRLPAIYHFGGLRAVVPTELIEDIRFYPGGFPVDYGRATGGIVDVRTQRDAPDRTTGHIDINLYDSGAFARIPLSDDATLELGARRSYVDAVLAAASGVLPLTFVTAPRYYDYQARLTLRLGDAHTLRLLALGSDDKLDLVLGDEDDLRPEDRGGISAGTWFHGGIVSLESALSSSVRNELRLQAQWQSLQFAFGDELYFDLRNRLYTFRDTVFWDVSDVLALRYGFDIEVYPGSVDVSLPRPPREGEEPVDFSSTDSIAAREAFSVYWPAHFVGAEVQPHDDVRVLGGLRHEYYRPTERHALDGRLAVRWDALEDATLKASVSNHHVSPLFDEVSKTFGNPDLRLEHALHYTTGAEVQLTDFLSVDVELFWKDLRDLVARTGETVERAGEVVPLVYDNSGRGRVYGAEILLRHAPANRFFGWIAYTLSRSERIDPETGEYRVFDFDQTHILTALGSYNLPRRWSIGARFRLVSGSPTTPIVGGVFDSDTGSYIRYPGDPNSERLPAFHQLDVRVDKRWIRDRRTSTLYLDIQNIYNRRNAEDLAYSHDYSETARVSGMPFFPALGFRTEW